MTEEDLERLAAAGVYDATAIDAQDQRQLLEQLLAQGLTVDELVDAQRVGNLVLQAFEQLLLPGERRTLAEVVSSTGLTHEQVLAVRRGWGLPDPPADRACFTPEEVAALEYVRNMAGFVGPDLAMHVAGPVVTIDVVFARARSSEGTWRAPSMFESGSSMSNVRARDPSANASITPRASATDSVATRRSSSCC